MYICIRSHTYCQCICLKQVFFHLVNFNISLMMVYSINNKFTLHLFKGNMARDMKCKVYVGDLGYGATKEELEEKFGKYGPLRSVWVARKPPGFAFVEFEDSRDAADAVRGIDGT